MFYDNNPIILYLVTKALKFYLDECTFDLIFSGVEVQLLEIGNTQVIHD